MARGLAYDPYAGPSFTPTENTAGVTDIQTGGSPLTPPIPGGTNLSTYKPPVAPKPATTAGAPTLNASDAASRRAFIDYYANQPGANPSLKNDPGYWDAKIASGELGSDPNYIIGKFMTPEGSGVPMGSLMSGGAFQWPTFTPPSYTPPPTYKPAQDTFSYADFKAPTADEAAAQPGYQFASREGRKALDNAAAHYGVLRSGGHLKDLYAWGDQFATQNYGNVLKQAEDIYGMNRGNAYQAWAGNNAVGADTYNINANQNQNAYQNNYQNAVAAFNPQFQAANLSFSDLYNRWHDSLNSTTQIATAGAGL